MTVPKANEKLKELKKEWSDIADIDELYWLAQDYIDALDMSIKALEKQIECDNCGYRIHSDNISKLNSCNDCGNQANCKDRPRLGEYCRINCKDWSKEK